MMLPVAKFFDRNVREHVALLLDPSGNTEVPENRMHDDNGFGAPRYALHVEEIFGAFKRMAIENNPAVPHLSLTTKLPLTTAPAQADSQWLFFEAENHMTPNQFSLALAIRLGIIPSHLKVENSKCNCGYLYGGIDDESIDHILTCDMSSPVTHTTRHNRVRDEIIRTCRSYGITTTTEPTCFTYDDSRHHRPDALFHTDPHGVAIDVSLVSTFPSQEAILKKEEEKKKIHSSAVKALSCIFFPFVMASRGTIGPEAEKFIRHIAKGLQPHLQHRFKRVLIHAVANAAAKGRADSLAAAAARQRL